MKTRSGFVSKHLPISYRTALDVLSNSCFNPVVVTKQPKQEKKGADLSAKDEEGKTALDYAEERDERKIKDILKNKSVGNSSYK